MEAGAVSEGWGRAGIWGWAGAAWAGLMEVHRSPYRWRGKTGPHSPTPLHREAGGQGCRGGESGAWWAAGALVGGAERQTEGHCSISVMTWSPSARP